MTTTTGVPAPLGPVDGSTVPGVDEVRNGLAKVGARLAAAQRKRDEARDALRAAVVAAVAAGMPETVAAKTAGVDRMTVRKWLGKL